MTATLNPQSHPHNRRFLRPTSSPLTAPSWSHQSLLFSSSVSTPPTADTSAPGVLLSASPVVVRV
jgi:hypothetical protein